MTIRQTIWQTIRKLRRFTAAQIVAEADSHPQTTKKYITRLEKAGYIARTGKAPRKSSSFRGQPGRAGNVSVVYELVRDIGAEAPLLDAAGGDVLRGRARDQMWRAMKMIGDFTCSELAFSASTEHVRVTLKHAAQYVYWLRKAGYLGVGAPGASHRLAIYRLARNTGARAPVVERLATVFDPNLGQVVWQAHPQ